MVGRERCLDHISLKDNRISLKDNRISLKDNRISNLRASTTSRDRSLNPNLQHQEGVRTSRR